MNWLRTYRLHAVAKRYALGLPKYLLHAYLDSDFYTRPQIDHAIEALNLPRDCIGLAYAAYLPKTGYDEIRATLPSPMSYEDARSEFFRHVPEPPPSGDWNPLTVNTLPYIPSSGNGG
jgi:hypothetical protein